MVIGNRDFEKFRFGISKNLNTNFNYPKILLN